jgi:hypothetical protein
MSTNKLIKSSLNLKQNLENLLKYVENNHKEFYIKKQYEFGDTLNITVFIVWFVVLLCMMANLILCCNHMCQCQQDKDEEESLIDRENIARGPSRDDMEA